MIKAGAIDKGTCLLVKEDPYLVTEREFVSPGKGSAFVRVKLKNLRTGQVLRQVLKSQETVEEASVEDRVAQYLYADGGVFHFMDNETYEQFEIPTEGFEDTGLLLKESESYKIIVFEGTPIDIKIPMKDVYEVAYAEEALKGDTVTGATKNVTLQTGLVVKVPIFIKQGEKILINTESKEYVERVNG